MVHQRFFFMVSQHSSMEEVPFKASYISLFCSCLLVHVDLWRRWGQVGGDSLPFHSLARSWSSRWQDLHACLHQAHPQGPPSHRPSPTGPLQCWGWQDGHLHHLGHHAAEDEGRGQLEHPPVREGDEIQTGSHGPNWGRFITIAQRKCNPTVNFP